MRRFAFLFWVLLAASCSLVNAPDEAAGPSGGGAGSGGEATGGHAGGGGNDGGGGTTDCGPLNTLANCGACGVPCEPANATSPTCASGSCDYASCAGGFDDCDGVRGNGCESNVATDPTNCGACQRDCADEVMNASALSCSTSVCGYQGCLGGFESCDGDSTNGCERSIETLTDCGGCNQPCTPANAVNPNCAGGVCQPGGCVDPFQDCDGNPENGCESNKLTDNGYCGNCATSCTSPAVCSNGSCVDVVTCANYDYPRVTLVNNTSCTGNYTGCTGTREFLVVGCYSANPPATDCPPGYSVASLMLIGQWAQTANITRFFSADNVCMYANGAVGQTACGAAHTTAYCWPKGAPCDASCPSNCCPPSPAPCSAGGYQAPLLCVND